MGKQIEIGLDDETSVGGWLAQPEGVAKGALVVIQEIFGVNAHMRDVADGYARDGYVALAPAFFDPVERDVELGYDEAGYARGKELVTELGVERALAIVEASLKLLQNEDLPVGAVGFCWGGTVAYLANTRFGLPAVSYYGGRTVQYLDEALRAPMMFHFGEQDPSISADDIAAHRARQPTAQVFTYPAGHAFNRDVDPKAYAPESAALARERTLGLFDAALR